jgi:hypothetical protein
LLRSSSGLSTTPATKLQVGLPHYYFEWASCAGDVNGDGYADLMAGGEPLPAFEPSRDVVFVYLGGPNGVATTPATTLAASTFHGIDDEFGADATALDVNGDGYWDIAVSDADVNSNYTSPFPQNENIYMGGPMGINATPATVFSQYGVNVAGVDANADGDEDLFQCFSTSTGAGSVFMLPGAATGLKTTPSLTIHTPAGDRVFGAPMMGAASGS